MINHLAIKLLLRPFQIRTPFLLRCGRNVVTTNSNVELEVDKNDDSTIKQLSLEKEKMLKKVSDLEKEIKILNNLRSETLQEVSRVRARADREIEIAKDFGCSSFAKDLLEVADVLDGAVDIVPASLIKEINSQENIFAQEFHKLYEGIIMTRNILQKTFSKNGIIRIEPKTGESFNPTEHSAKYEMPSVEGGPPPKTIGEIFRPGYSIKGRVLRPAEVGVIQYN